MIIRRLLTLTLISALMPLSQVAAEGNDPGYTQLEEQMEEINVAYRRLGRQVTDATKNADSLTRAATIRQFATSALELTPKKAAELPESERAKFVAAYREKMKAFIGDVEKLEAALKANNNEEAERLLGLLRDAQEEGHRDFRPKKMTFEEKAAEAARRSEEFNEQNERKHNERQHR